MGDEITQPIWGYFVIPNLGLFRHDEITPIKEIFQEIAVNNFVNSLVNSFIWTIFPTTLGDEIMVK